MGLPKAPKGFHLPWSKNKDAKKKADSSQEKVDSSQPSIEQATPPAPADEASPQESQKEEKSGSFLNPIKKMLRKIRPSSSDRSEEQKTKPSIEQATPPAPADNPNTIADEASSQESQKEDKSGSFLDPIKKIPEMIKQITSNKSAISEEQKTIQSLEEQVQKLEKRVSAMTALAICAIIVALATVAFHFVLHLPR